MSTALFNIALHSVINKMDQKGTHFLKSSQIRAYADDLVIVTRDVNSLKPMYLEFEREIRIIGLSMNEKKANYMIVLSPEVRSRPQNLFVGEKSFKASLVLIIWEP
jgi:hypothetical protein